MDIADDIAYSLHDLDDFHRAGVLQHASVAAEFRTWIRRRPDSPGTTLDIGAAVTGVHRGWHSGRRWPIGSRAWRWNSCGAGCGPGTAGSSTTTPSGWRSAGWPPTWSTACSRCRSTPRSPPNGRSGTFTGAGSPTCEASVEVSADPPVRAGHVVLGRQAWHEVAVLKFVHQRFVLDRPDLAMFQRGQAEALTSLVANLESWLTDPVDAGRAPRRLIDLVELATAGYRRVAQRGARSCWSDRPGSRPPPGTTSSGSAAAAASSTTSPRSPTTGPAASARTLAGFTGQLWDAGSGL